MAYYKDGRTYECEVIQQGFNESSAKKTSGFFLIVKPICEVHPETGEHVEDCLPYERTVQFWITEKTAERIITDLRKLGFEGKAFIDLDPDRRGTYSFVGQRIRVVCKHETSDGKTYDKFELPFLGSPRVIPNQSNVASKLDNLFGKKLKTSAGPAAPAVQSEKPKPASKTAPARQTVPADVNAELQEDDTDIPF
jgi:hypothetical protein